MISWVQHFDVYDWDVEFNISWESFPSDHWECDTAATNTGLNTDAIEDWYEGYRPTHMRVTYSGDPIAQLSLYDTNSDQIAVKVAYTSLEEVAIDFGSYDIDKIFFAKGSGDDIDIDNIEFGSSSSSSTSSSSSSSKSSSSSSRSSSSKSSSSSSAWTSSSSSRSSSSSSSSKSSSSSSLSSSSRSSSSSSSSSFSSSSSSSSSSSKSLSSSSRSSSSRSSSSSSFFTSSSSSRSSSSSSSRSSSSSSSRSSSSSSSSKSSSSSSKSSSSISYTPFSQDIKLDITITKSSQIWGYVRDWRGHIVRKICKIVISSLDESQTYAITESNPVDGSFSSRISISTGSSVLLTCFYEGTFRGQYNLAGSLILTTGSSSSSFSSSSFSSSSSSSSSNSSSSSSSSG